MTVAVWTDWKGPLSGVPGASQCQQHGASCPLIAHGPYSIVCKGAQLVLSYKGAVEHVAILGTIYSRTFAHCFRRG